LVLTFALNQIPGLNALPTVLSKTVDKVLGTPLRLVNQAADATIEFRDGLHDTVSMMPISLITVAWACRRFALGMADSVS